MSTQSLDLEFKLNENGTEYVLSRCNSIESSVDIPSQYNGKPVTSIGDLAFDGCSSLESVTIPDGVISIGEWAFNKCRLLKNIIIPTSVISIGEWAFCDCSSLESITIPTGVTSIGEWAFCDCSLLRNIIISDSVENIGQKVFQGCKSLEKITMPISLMTKNLFDDLTLFYNLKLKLYKNNSNIKLDKINIKKLSAIESTLKTVPSKRTVSLILGITIASILLMLSSIPLAFISENEDVSIFTFMIGCTFSVGFGIANLINLATRNTKHQNIEKRFSELDYHQMQIQEENNNLAHRETVAKNSVSKELSIKEKLTQVKELYEEGLITEAEYNEQRKEYISKL